MKTRRLHVTGASGAGVTTLGARLASAVGAPHHDTDDFYWRSTTPPFRTKRPVEDRLRLMEEMFLGRSDWVLSGSVSEWAAPVAALFDAVVFVRTDAAIRLERLRDREALRFGEDAVSPGGWRETETQEFIDWAAGYDSGAVEGRSLPRHEAWLAKLKCPVYRIDGARPTDDLVVDLLQAMKRGSP